MVKPEEAAAIAAGLPEVTEGARHGMRTWFVGKKSFAWERPLSKADIRRFGDEPIPQGPIFAVRAEDMNDKEAILAEAKKGFFDMEHFRNYPAFLIQLDKVAKRDLRDAIVDGWLACAPRKLAELHAAALTKRR